MEAFLLVIIWTLFWRCPAYCTGVLTPEFHVRGDHRHPVANRVRHKALAPAGDYAPGLETVEYSGVSEPSPWAGEGWVCSRGQTHRFWVCEAERQLKCSVLQHGAFRHDSVPCPRSTPGRRKNRSWKIWCLQLRNLVLGSDHGPNPVPRHGAHQNGSHCREAQRASRVASGLSTGSSSADREVLGP